jgi:hypothetical protein
MAHHLYGKGFAISCGASQHQAHSHLVSDVVDELRDGQAGLVLGLQLNLSRTGISAGVSAAGSTRRRRC